MAGEADVGIRQRPLTKATLRRQLSLACVCVCVCASVAQEAE